MNGFVAPSSFHRGTGGASTGQMLLALLLAAAQADPEAELLAAANRVRTRPAESAADLRRYAAAFRGSVAPEGWTTVEGPAPVLEAAAALEGPPPPGPLAPSPPLARAARMLADDHARSGATGHLTRDRRGPGDRTRAAGGGPYVAEVVAYGFDAPEQAVRQWLVDDGVRGRGHRVLLMNPRARFAGVGCAPHPRLRITCAMILSETPDGSPAVPPRGP